MGQVNKNHRAIVFDFGGVLIDWNPRYLYRKLFDGDLQAMEYFLAKVGFAEWNLQQDKGRPFGEAVTSLSMQFPEYEQLIKAYDQRWEESIGGAIQPTVNILQSLKQAGYPLYGLSNWSAEKFQLVRRRYEFFDWFEAILVSGEVKLIKPDPRIYVLFLNKIGRAADECLYIDDSAANIATAAQLGFATIQYESSEQLEAALRQMSLI